MDIKKANQGQAYRMLQCLAVAIRPLSVGELAELLAFEFDATKGGIPKLNADWRWEDHEQAVLSTCSSLITIVSTEGSHIVQFSHFSVKEFLMSDRLSTLTKDVSQYHIVHEDANTLIARACLSVLLRDPVDENGASPAPLALYAAEHWVSHARVEKVASRIREGMLCLFDPDRRYFSAWLELHNVDHSGWLLDLRGNIQQRAAPLYYAAFCGFHDIVDHLTLKYPTYANAIGGYGGTALHSASYAGHIQVVRSLLKCGVDVDTPGYWAQSSLQLASIKGHLDIVLCLLDHGADAKFRDAKHRTPLDHAAAGGHLEIVRVLLGRDADVNYQDKVGSTPMANTILYGRPKGDHSQIVQLFLEHGANPNTRDRKRHTPLHLVSSPHLSRGLVLPVRLEIARILLAHGADVDAEDNEGRTPLQVASSVGDGEMVQLLSAYSPK